MDQVEQEKVPDEMGGVNTPLEYGAEMILEEQHNPSSEQQSPTSHHYSLPPNMTMDQLSADGNHLLEIQQTETNEFASVGVHMPLQITECEAELIQDDQQNPSSKQQNPCDGTEHQQQQQKLYCKKELGIEVDDEQSVVVVVAGQQQTPPQQQLVRGDDDNGIEHTTSNSCLLQAEMQSNALDTLLEQFQQRQQQMGMLNFSPVHQELVEELLQQYLAGKQTLQQLGFWLDNCEECFSMENYKRAVQLRIVFGKLIKDLWELMQPLDASDTEHQFKQLHDKFHGVITEWIQKATDLLPPMDKMEFVLRFKQKGGTYIGRNTLEPIQLIKEKGEYFQQMYLFFHDWDPPKEQKQQKQNNNANMELIECLQAEGNCCMFVDLAVGNSEQHAQQQLLALYNCGQQGTHFKSHIIMLRPQDMQIECADYLVVKKEKKRKLNTCMVRICNKDRTLKLQGNFYKTVDEHIPIELPCPLSLPINGANCPKEDLLWECDDCGQIINIHSEKPTRGVGLGSHNMLICGCGITSAEEFAFRCKNTETHGASHFVRFPTVALNLALDSFCKFGEKNILIVGETGVGKSTWINSLANYLTYGTLDEALESKEPICLIPSKFELSDEEYNMHTVQIGKLDCHERQEIGLSGTIYPKAHVLVIRGGKLRLIDTPGIGDTGGTDEDKKNCQNTLNYIANLDEIHAILFMLKPTKLTKQNGQM